MASTTRASYSRFVLGPPESTKRALVLHDLTCSSQTMKHVAEGLASHGYLVTVPDFPGHGFAPRQESYSWEDMMEFVKSLLHETTYDLVVGHSMGGLLALRVLHQLPIIYATRQQPLRVVMVDIGISQSKEVVEPFITTFRSLTEHAPEPNLYMKSYPRWTRQDAMLQVLANELCDPEVVYPLLLKPDPWDFTQYLVDIPPCVQPTFVVGDPEVRGLCRVSVLDGYPNFKVKVITGSSHWIPYEFPEEPPTRLKHSPRPPLAMSYSSRHVIGSPESTKRALLLHGLTCSSHGMKSIAEGLASHGYLVTAPDYPGHGFAPRQASYSWDNLLDFVKSLLEETTYDLVIGHSMGALLLLRLVHQLPAAYAARNQPLRVVLIEPAVLLGKDTLEPLIGMFRNLTEKAPEPEFYAKLYPRWTKQDAMVHVLANELCDPEVVHPMLSKPDPWDFREYLIDIPSFVQATALLGDPEAGGLCRLSDFDDLPNLTAKIIPGVSHWVTYESPEEVVQASIR
ncbi:alpha beta-hydrolase [Coniophora puteana RWD-64-598 SS2]|uniref:Alpha beta-hydrolase n=1 Tax=Coniophora puteana (strain RWD-64-598) TaxID=741705 RepID=A0A5M3MXQ4_CONPW|nr:alpha beta-hydrolase [Coniophora puteana RWD-64-598 SS2]EIW83890.1 alpha beta-hydrolase [Coniophora puteana RWD-64-598 SS2]